MHRLSGLIVLLSLMTNAMVQAETFSQLLERLRSTSDTLAKRKIVDNFFALNTFPIVESDKIHFVYRGRGTKVAVPGELNGWNPAISRMENLPGTDLFYRSESLAINGRLEYKIWVDSSWMLDPLNGRRALGGFGYNSDVWMPDYVQSFIERYQPVVRHGRIDSFVFESAILHRAYPIHVYHPTVKRRKQPLPVVYVTDGGDYKELGRMIVILDNLLSERRIAPVIAVFVDPRTIPDDPSSNVRMVDYSANDAYLDFLENELSPHLTKRYGSTKLPKERLILGASMGGLIATYAVLQRHRFIQNCAAQSPAYLQADSTVLELIKGMNAIAGTFYIDTGTINDTEKEARRASILLRERGADVVFAEYPEGHNWTNWRARIPLILQHFFPRK